MSNNFAMLLYKALTRSGTALYSQVGARVWQEIPPDTWNGTTKCIVFNVITDTRESFGTIAIATVQFTCYGGSKRLADATDVYVALLDTLNGLFYKDVIGVIMYAKMISGVSGDIRIDDEFPYAEATFEIGYQLI